MWKSQRSQHCFVFTLTVLVLCRLCVHLLLWPPLNPVPTHPTYQSAMTSLLLQLEQLAAADPRLVYWTTCGTLLGWARTGAVIAYDDDVDVGVPSDVLDWMRDDAGVHALLVRHNLSVCFNTGVQRPVKLFSVHSYLPFVDLIRHTPTTDGAYWASDWVLEGFWANELFPLRRCELSGVKMWCPLSPWPYLERVYGGTLVWLVTGRHWTVPSHYAEHSGARTRPYVPARPREGDPDLECGGGAVNVRWG
jgi:hypothetical protein